MNLVCMNVLIDASYPRWRLLRRKIPTHVLLLSLIIFKMMRFNGELEPISHHWILNRFGEEEDEEQGGGEGEKEEVGGKVP